MRLEVSAIASGETRRFDWPTYTSALLPRFVPSRTRDPRAPQNLVPIGALEQHLRRGLGDARLIHRRLATLLARELIACLNRLRSVVGLVLGSQDATPLEFWVGVREGERLQLDDLVVTRTTLERWR